MDSTLDPKPPISVDQLMQSVQLPQVGSFFTVLDHATSAFRLNVPQIVDIDYLRSLPDDSLGKAWADHLDAVGLAPFIMGSRSQQIHDGVHVLTGYNTTPLGEAEVQCFLLGTHFRPQNFFLALSLQVPIVRHLLLTHNLAQIPQIWERLWHAFHRGQRSHFDFLKWHPEEQWALPLASIQTCYRITA